MIFDGSHRAIGRRFAVGLLAVLGILPTGAAPAAAHDSGHGEAFTAEANSTLRKDLTVPVYLCGPTALSEDLVQAGSSFHRLTDEGLANVVDTWNRIEAPWYSWQSSGAFNISLVPAKTIRIEPDEWFSDENYHNADYYHLPALCTDEANRHGGDGPKIYLISDLPGGPAGWAVVGGELAVVYVRHSQDLAVDSQLPQDSFLR